MKKFLLPIIFIFVILVIFLPRLLIKVKIVCKSQFGACPTLLEDEIRPFANKSIYTAEKMIKKELTGNYLVSAFSIQYKIPNILIIDTIIKSPVYALSTGSKSSYDLIDKDGTVLAVSTSTELPVVIYNGNLPNVGEKVNNELLLALSLVEGVYKMYQVKEGLISDNTLLVDIPGQIRVIFPLAGEDRDLLLGSLRLIYASIEKGSVKYSQIDLRYNNPVLR